MTGCLGPTQQRGETSGTRLISDTKTRTRRSSYPAFRSLADLERLANHPEQAARFERRAGRIARRMCPLFSIRRPVFWPAGKILAVNCTTTGSSSSMAWPSRTDWSMMISPIQSSIVSSENEGGRIHSVRPRVARQSRTNSQERLRTSVLGSPQKDDGSDTFGVFENGGASACYAYFYVQALYQLGRREEAVVLTFSGQ